MILKAVKDIFKPRASALEQKMDLLLDHLWHIRHYNHEIIKALKFAQLSDEKVVTFYHDGSHQIHFHVPKATMDYIQGFHVMHESFWDLPTLTTLPDLKGKHVLDIGANVGNHAVYWGKIVGAESIVAFEPVAEIADIFERNASLNGLSNVRLERVALGEEDAKGTISSDAANRMQSEIHVDSCGKTTIRRLDSYSFERVDFMKVDVEGHTIGLLRGAQETISKHRPDIFIELFTHERAECDGILKSLDYRMAREYPDNNYLYQSKALMAP